ncbi:MAG: cation transporter [Eubacterium sp.]|nr:cation transporter [Eubacterium sp.]MBQ8980590.1 cation transporter [Eubacterium sp.]MBR1532632.1 cation transporter [Eubacterium sp.]MBR2279246.1 cation transporter [Eubacterium sp.]
MKKVYKIDIDCANCAAKMEAEANKVDGVKEASVNFMMLKMNIEFEDGADEKSVMKKVRKVCRKVDDDAEVYI